jgi:hypothetical protein
VSKQCIINAICSKVIYSQSYKFIMIKGYESKYINKQISHLFLLRSWVRNWDISRLLGQKSTGWNRISFLLGYDVRVRFLEYYSFSFCNLFWYQVFWSEIMPIELLRSASTLFAFSISHRNLRFFFIKAAFGSKRVKSPVFSRPPPLACFAVFNALEEEFQLLWRNSMIPLAQDFQLFLFQSLTPIA